MTEKEREDWALADREAKVVIGLMFAFQSAFLAVAMLWL